MSLAGFRHSLAVVVGIDTYAHGIPPLRTAATDARSVARRLKEKHGYEVTSLLDAEATGDALRAQLRETLPRRLSGADRLVLYFAGHGVALDGDAGPEGFLLPHDARGGARKTFFAMTELHELLSALPCRHLLVVLDCCFAGAFRWSSTRHFALAPEVIYAERYERFVRDPAWQVLASAAFDQRALDVVDGHPIGQRDEGERHSPFAAALLDALDGAADLPAADGRGDGVITATELYVYLRDRVEVLRTGRLRQTPSLWPLPKHDKGEYVFLAPGAELRLRPAPALTDESNPFRGLEPFGTVHANFFFGRRRVIAALSAQVAAHPLTVVLGGSGSGKSSLVKAGLIPALQPAGAPSAWEVMPTRPGASPLLALRSLPLPEPEVGLAARVDAWLKVHSGRRLLIVVDQFEELVTLAKDRKDADPSRTDSARFLDELARTVADHGQNARVVVTLRSDFAPQFADGPLRPWWNAARFLVPPLSQDELREVIEGPASASVLYYDPPALVETLINEVAQTPGALPLLSFTLSELYHAYLRRGAADRSLTQCDYDTLGGVAGSLRHRATHEYKTLPDEAARVTMRRVLLRMVSFEGGELSRRRVPRSELEYAEAAENARVAEVLARLTQARLIVPDQDPDGTPVVEPAHDALVRGWDLLLAWRQQADDEIELRARLAPAVQDWTRGGAGARGLWHADPRLPLLRATGPWLNAAEERFRRASVHLRRRRRLGAVLGSVAIAAALGWLGWATWQETRGRRDAERNTALRQAADQFQRANGLAAGGNVLPALGLACLAAEQAPADDPAGSLYLRRLMSLAATAPTSILNLDAPVRGAVFSPDLDRVLLVSAEGKARIIDPRSGQEFPAPFDEKAVDYQVLDAESNRPIRPVFSADGRRIAALVSKPKAPGSPRDTYLVVWDLDTGYVRLDAALEPAREWARENFRGRDELMAIHSLALSADGELAAVGIQVDGDELLARTWDCATGQACDPTNPITTLALPGEQNPLVLGHGWIATVRKVPTPPKPPGDGPPGAPLDHELRVTGLRSTAPGHPEIRLPMSGPPASFAASLDGRYVAGAMQLEFPEIFVLDVPSGSRQDTKERSRLAEPLLGAPVRIEATSAGGRFSIYAPAADLLAVFSFAEDAPAKNAVIKLPSGRAGTFERATASADGQRAFTFSKSRVFCRYDPIEGAGLIDALPGEPPLALPEGTVAGGVRPDGRRLAAVTGDGQVLGWELPRPAESHELARGLRVRPTDWITGARFVDGDRVLTAATDVRGNPRESTFQCWTLSPVARPAWPKPPAFALPVMPPRELAVDAVRGRFAVVAKDGRVNRLRLLDLASGEEVPAPPLEDPGSHLGFTRDGWLVHVQRASSGYVAGIVAPTGEPPENRERPLREGKFRTLCANAEFLVTMPADSARGADRVLAARQSRDGSRVTPDLLFASDDDYFLGASLLRQAVKIEMAGTFRDDDPLLTKGVIRHKGGILKVTAEGGAALGFIVEDLLGDGRLHARALYAFTAARDRDTGRDYLFLAHGPSVVVPHGAEPTWRYLFSGEQLAQPLWHESEVTALQVSADGRDVLTVTRAGVARRWRLEFPAARARPWLNGLSQALTGLNLARFGPSSPLPAEEFKAGRAVLFTRLEAAAADGDEEAGRLLSWLRR